ncbi:MAG: hypothetical protein QXI71_06425, partial [Candidatus Bathyarchaeia archaeon]
PQPHSGHLTVFSPLTFLTSKQPKRVKFEENTQKNGDLRGKSIISAQIGYPGFGLLNILCLCGFI